jgi:DNA invertase Pin-like site-specific DNA recombinase
MSQEPSLRQSGRFVRRALTAYTALYVRVSTDRQTVENQIARLTEIAKGRGWQIVQTFSDAGKRSQGQERASQF